MTEQAPRQGDGTEPTQDASQPDERFLGGFAATEASQTACGAPPAGDARARVWDASRRDGSGLPRELVVLRDPATGEPMEVV